MAKVRLGVGARYVVGDEPWRVRRGPDNTGFASLLKKESLSESCSFYSHFINLWWFRHLLSLGITFSKCKVQRLY